MYSFVEIMHFQNHSSSVNMLPLYFLNILIVPKLSTAYIKFFLKIFKTGNHISASYLHLASTLPKTT